MRSLAGDQEPWDEEDRKAMEASFLRILTAVATCFLPLVNNQEEAILVAKDVLEHDRSIAFKQDFEGYKMPAGVVVQSRWLQATCDCCTPGHSEIAYFVGASGSQVDFHTIYLAADGKI